MKKKKEAHLNIKKPWWYIIKEKWSDEQFKKKLDNYLFIAVVILLIIVAAFKTVQIRNKQSLYKLKEALSTLDEITQEENPKKVDAIFKTNKEKYEATLNKLDNMIAKSKYTKGEKVGIFYKGILQVKLGKYEDAIKSFDKFLKYKKSAFYPLAYIYKGICYEYLKKFKEAKTLFKNGINQFKGNVYELYSAYYYSLDSEITNSLNDKVIESLKKYQDIKEEDLEDSYIYRILKNRVNYILSR